MLSLPRRGSMIHISTHEPGLGQPYPVPVKNMVWPKTAPHNVIILKGKDPLVLSYRPGLISSEPLCISSSLTQGPSSQLMVSLEPQMSSNTWPGWFGLGHQKLCQWLAVDIQQQPASGPPDGIRISLGTPSSQPCYSGWHQPSLYPHGPSHPSSPQATWERLGAGPSGSSARLHLSPAYL